MTRAAVAVIGSNSTRVVSADLADPLEHIRRRRISTRLFLHMENGLLPPQAIADTAEGIRGLIAAENARLLGVYATSAVRDAQNAPALAAAVEAVCGLPLVILSGEDEAAASFYGACGDARGGIIDIGGGSTELAIGQGRRTEAAVSLQLGASRLFRQCPIHTAADVAPALAVAGAAVQGLPAALLTHAGVNRFYLVGGTGTNAVGLLGGDLGAAEGFLIGRDRLYQCLCAVAAVPSAQRALIPHFPPARADILPTGMAILVTVMDALRLREVAVTERCNADGLLRAFVHKKFA